MNPFYIRFNPMVGLVGPGGEHHQEILASGSRGRARILEIMFSFLGSGAGTDHCVYVLVSGLREQLRILGVLSFHLGFGASPDS